MELITIPKDLYLNRVKYVRRVALSMIPFIAVVFILMWELWIGIAVTILFITILAIGGYKADSRSKHEIITWATLNYPKARVELEELLQAKRLTEQRSEPKPTLVNFLIGWYVFLALYFIYIFLYLFFSINFLAIPEDVLLYLSIGMLIATIVFSGGSPYLEKRNLAILKPLVLMRASFFVFLLIFGYFYLICVAFLGSSGSAIEFILAFNFVIVGFTSYFEYYFLWEKFVDSKAVSEEFMAKCQKIYLIIAFTNSLLALVFISQYGYFQADTPSTFIYLIILLAFGEMISGATNTKLYEYWRSLPSESNYHLPSSAQELDKQPKILPEEFYKFRIIPLQVILFMVYLIFLFNLFSLPLSEYDWYILLFPVLGKLVFIGEFFYHLYKRKREFKDVMG